MCIKKIKETITLDFLSKAVTYFVKVALIISFIAFFAFVIYNIQQPRCALPSYELYALLRCGNPVANWLYDFQAIIAGVGALLAAGITAYIMHKNSIREEQNAKDHHNRIIIKYHERIDSFLEKIINKANASEYYPAPVSFAQEVSNEYHTRNTIPDIIGWCDVLLTFYEKIDMQDMDVFLGIKFIMNCFF